MYFVRVGVLGKRFTITEIQAATENFDLSLVIGVCGFGKAYKGEINDGILAAIKLVYPQFEQGLVKFEIKIELLSKLRHGHWFPGSSRNNEMILVHEYMVLTPKNNYLNYRDCFLASKVPLDLIPAHKSELKYIKFSSRISPPEDLVSLRAVVLSIAKENVFGISLTMGSQNDPKILGAF
ncbi:hypothetical protein NE237_001536 [Protea cynaroides]|uniref:Uncharacterized protein n=1 Tax=Protea cynaroides TaxID=273540 RepID=A0A9Q0KTH9_9MAGN|nr:hypothetical protein NE237_001536 [Protea cynaroides]